MELVCYKYNEKMDAEDALCRHTGDYCKFRTSCIIHFIESERKSDDKSGQEAPVIEERHEKKK